MGSTIKIGKKGRKNPEFVFYYIFNKAAHFSVIPKVVFFDCQAPFELTNLKDDDCYSIFYASRPLKNVDPNLFNYL